MSHKENNSIKKIFFFQPAVPKYRIDFFDRISKKYDITIYTTEHDFLNVKTFKVRNFIKCVGYFKSILKKLYWHKEISLWKKYNKNTILIINGNPRIINYMILLILCRFRNIKTVWWGHGWSSTSGYFSSIIRIKMMKLATIVLVYTDLEKEKLSKYNLNRIHALNNGLNSDEINTFNHLNVNIKNKVGRRIIFIGRLTNKSNICFLIRAFAKCSHSLSLTIIGDGPELNKAKKLAEDLKCVERIEWCGEIIDESKIASYMLKSDVFIYPGSIGLSLIHAFNYGLPAIIHNVQSKHMPESASFIPNYNGVNFEYNNINSLITTLNKIATINDDELLRLSKNAKKTIEKSYNTLDMSVRFFNMIDDI